MCDYSLELYRSRPAVAGERYVTSRFPSGSIGFIAPGDSDTAICLSCDTRIELKDIPVGVQARLGTPAAVEATFVHVERGPHHDGIRFADGGEVTLQELGPGVTASVIDVLTRPVVPVARRLEPEFVR